MSGLEPWPECPACESSPIPHDHTRYGGEAFLSAAAILLREAHAEDEQVALVMRALERAA